MARRQTAPPQQPVTGALVGGGAACCCLVARTGSLAGHTMKISRLTSRTSFAARRPRKNANLALARLYARPAAAKQRLLGGADLGQNELQQAAAHVATLLGAAAANAAAAAQMIERATLGK